MMDELYVKTFIFCTKKRAGKGVTHDPIRVITEIYDFDGTLIMDKDPCRIYTDKDMFEFAELCVSQNKVNEVLLQNFKSSHK